MNQSSLLALLFLILATGCASLSDKESNAPVKPATLWTPAQANAWYDKQPWLVGANFGPSTAINQLEMWQADSFDLKTIDRELAWAKSLGFNSMRVFLHHLLWEQDPKGFLKRLDQYLEVSDKHDIGTMFVLFDSVWDPEPRLGKQREPQKGLHNSGWVQTPGKHDLMDKSRHALLEAYVKGVVGRFRDDPRVQVWDVWNEPDNMNGNSYGDKHLKTELSKEQKHQAVLDLLPKVFAWARAAGPTQPLTSGLWLGGHKADPAKLIPIEKVQLAESDVISFHCYDDIKGNQIWVKRLREAGQGRPLLCTEYMARPNGSNFDPILAYYKAERIAAYNWGFVAGKTNTIYPWDSWQKPYVDEKGNAKEPPVWFHDIFRADGTPYREEEVKYIRSVTEAK